MANKYKTFDEAHRELWKLSVDVPQFGGKSKSFNEMLGEAIKENEHLLEENAESQDMDPLKDLRPSDKIA